MSLKETDKLRQTETDKLAEGDRQTDRPTKGDRQTERETCWLKETNRLTDRQTD